MDTDEFHKIYRLAVLNVYNLGSDYIPEKISWRENVYAKKLQRVFSYPIFDDWIDRTISEENPLTARQKAMLHKMSGPYGRIIYLALCAKKGIEP